MTMNSARLDAYREQLARYTAALASARDEAVRDALEEGQRPIGLRVFAASNINKRYEQLRGQVDCLAEAFDRLDKLMADYIRECPLNPYCTIASEGERFLRWLGRSRDLSPEQRDYVAYRQAHYAVEAEGRANRRGHIRFQELWSVAQQLAPELDANSELQIFINPIGAWAHLETRALLDDDSAAPADALFFAVRDEVRTAVLGPSGRGFVQELSTYGPCSLAAWSGLTEHGTRADLIEFCRDLSEMGLVAFR